MALTNTSQAIGNKRVVIAIIAFCSFILFAFYFDYLIITSIGLAFSLYISLDFIDQLGKDYPLKQLIVMLSSIQWVVGAKVSYEYGKLHYKYFMYVEEERYMALIVPSIIFLHFGLIVFKTPNLKDKLDFYLNEYKGELKKLSKTAVSVFLIGISGFVLGRLVNIPSLAFIFYLMSLLTYVSVGYFFFLYPNRKTLIFFFILLIAFYQALMIGMFHNFLLISVFLFAVYLNKKSSFLKKLSIIVLSTMVINIIQVVKQDYRDIIWNSQTSNAVEIFFELVEKELFISPNDSQTLTYSDSGDKLDEDEVKVTTRLNQGWIISKVMDHVPRNQEYLGGESIGAAITASFIPRFLVPSKTSTGDAKVTFEKVTGLRLIKGTSMGLSLVGEFYANYGTYGAWVGLLIYGFFISLTIKMLIQNTNYSPFIILWFVLFFFQVVKAETELIKIINHLFKSIVFFVLLQLILRFFGVDLLPYKSKVN